MNVLSSTLGLAYLLQSLSLSQLNNQTQYNYNNKLTISHA